MSVQDLIVAKFEARDVSRFERDFGRAGGAVEGFESKWKGVASLVAGGLALGGLNALSNNLVQAGNEANNISAKLDGMLRARGQNGARVELDAVSESLSKLTGMDDDLFSDAQAHLLSFGLNAKQIGQIMPGLVGQANTMGQSLDGVADSFGRAFASGNAGALIRSGVVLSKADQDAIKAAKSISEAAGQQELFNRVLDSYQQFAVKAGEGITDAARAQGNFNTQIGNFQELIGTGASEARAKWQNSLTPLLEGMNKERGGLLKNIGAATEYATVIGNVTAPIYGLASAFGELRNYQNLAKIAQIGETAAETAKIGVAGKHGSAMGDLADTIGDTSKATRVLADDTGAAADKLTKFARLKNLMNTPLGNLKMLNGAPVTAGAAALGGALGIGAGIGARNDMRDLGYSDGQSNAYGAATGISAALVSMFVPGGAIAVGIGEGIRLMLNNSTAKLDDTATGANKNSKGEEFFSTDLDKGTRAERSKKYREQANELEEKSRRRQMDALNPGDWSAGLDAATLANDAVISRRKAAQLDREGQRLGAEEMRQRPIRENEARFQQSKRMLDQVPPTQYIQDLRNGETEMRVVVRVPERPADRSYKQLRRNTITPAPDFAG